MLHKIKILAVLFFTVTLVSCSDSILDNPESTETENTVFSKTSKNFENIKSANDVNTILESDSPPTTVTKIINGKTGGVINLTGLHIGLDLRIITVNATLTIPPAAFEGTKSITLIADYQTPGIICQPSMEFDVPLQLDLAYVGIDILGLLFNHDNVFFAYLGDDGTVKPCQYEGIDLNLLGGLLGVRKAKIEHFSRYGFSR